MTRKSFYLFMVILCIFAIIAGLIGVAIEATFFKGLILGMNIAFFAVWAERWMHE